MKHSARPAAQQGLTLVELMIALTLGLIVIAALVAVFMTSNQNYRQNEAIATIQDNARFALDSLTRDLAMAGYWGGVRPVDAAVNIRVSSAAAAAVAKAAAGDCGPTGQAASYYWLFDVGVPLVFRNHKKAGSVSADFTCLIPADVQPNTDIVMIRRVSGAPAAATTANRFYVKTNQNIGSVFRAGSSFNVASPADCIDGSGTSAPCPPTATPVQLYAYTPVIYYIRSYLGKNADGTPIYDGKPILCRRYLNDTISPPKMDEDCLAEGVENLQIEWGIGSGTVENYLPDPDATQLLEARTARIHILVRSLDKNVQASADVKTYRIADLTDSGRSDWTPPADNPPAFVLRRLFTTTVQLKNLHP